MDENELQSKWPGIKYAYDFVLPSYQWMLTRFEAADSRIQTLQTFIVTITFGFAAIVTALSNKGELRFISWPFITAMGLAVLAIIMGAVGRSWGGIMIVNPTVLYKEWLHNEEYLFKKDMVFFAGEHFTKNVDVVTKKACIAAAMTILFLAEMGLLLFWIIFSKN